MTKRTKPVRLLVAGGVWPHYEGNFEAANVVSYEILHFFSGRPGWRVAFCLVSSRLPELPAAGRAELDKLARAGLEVLEPIRFDDALPGRARRWWGTLTADPRVLYPARVASPELERRARAWRTDALMTIWSEAATAAAAPLDVPLLTYYGNPDHKVREAAARFEWERRPRSPRTLLSYAVRRARIDCLRRAHLRVMKRYALIAEVAENDALYYRACGLSGAHYVRNMWPVRTLRDYRVERRKSEQLHPAKLIASVGNLSATGNTLGFDTMAREVLPVLKRILGTDAFELHVFGARQPHPLVAPLLGDPHIRLRGFVPDLDAEILSAPLFLVANNHRYFKVGHTRFLHAWSLGACIVAFRDSAEAMPELVHGENVLLAGNAEEFGRHVHAALADRELRERLAIGGQRTVREKFAPEVVCRGLEDHMRRALEEAGA